MLSVKNLLKRFGLYRLAQEYVNWRLRPGRLDFYSKLVGRGDLCFDVGANVGSRTDIFLRLGAKVVAIEPQPEPFRILCHRFGKNAEFVAINKGLGASERMGTMFLCSSDGSSSFSKEWITKVSETGRFAKTVTWGRALELPITTLDSLIAQFGLPKFCKWDVEGYEYEVIKGLSTPIPLVSFEFTPEVLDESLSVIARLESMDEYEFNYVLGESTDFQSTKWLNQSEVCLALDRFKQTLQWGDVYGRLCAVDSSATT